MDKIKESSERWLSSIERNDQPEIKFISEKEIIQQLQAQLDEANEFRNLLKHFMEIDLDMSEKELITSYVELKEKYKV